MGQDCDGSPNYIGEEDNGVEDVVDCANNDIDDGEESTGSIPSPLFSGTRPSKRLRSKVWEDFIPTFVDGKAVQAECMHCHRIFNYNSTNGTTGLRNHQAKCGPRTQKRLKQQVGRPLPSTKKSTPADSSDPNQKKLPFLLSHQNKCTGAADAVPVQELAFPDAHTNKNNKNQEVDQNGSHEVLAAPELSTDQYKSQLHGEIALPEQDFPNDSSQKNQKVDQNCSPEELVRILAIHGHLPRMMEQDGFRKVAACLNPMVNMPSHSDFIGNICDLFQQEKSKLKEKLAALRSRVCLSAYMWHYDPHLAFLCLTVHYIDDEWEKQQKVITFSPMDPSCDAKQYNDIIAGAIREWDLHDKVFSIIVDDVFIDDSVASNIKTSLQKWNKVNANQNLFVVRLAWNYLPSVRLHAAPGVLEVVRWRLAEEEESAPPSKCSFLATVPFRFPDQEPDLATRGCAFGLVRSVSVVFSMPLAKVDAGSRNPVGFLAEILCCGCRRCCRATLPEDAQSHKFETMKFVYFVDAWSMWRPVLVWLVGRLVYVSGLKKKMVSVGDKASHTTLVSSAKTAIAWCPSYRGSLPLDSFPEKCSGEYAGVITGIYSQGLVVELDNTAWLLIDDQQLPPPHSLRVGAIVSVKNFRATCLNFAWTRIVLLATCCKTCITVNYFSLVDSKIHLKTENKGLLGTFVDSLEMPARFWMLLLISCFKQKFTKLFSDKEILGSQNKQGVVHAYATKILPSKCQPKESLIMKFCRHNCGSLILGSKLESCKLAIPFSNLVFKGESLWISSMLKLWNGSEEVGKSQGFLCDGFSYTSSTKRLISSEDLDFVLVGSIKTSPLSGRLQLVDSTGCIDIFIPDLPPNESLYGIYEIVDYKLALEGPVAYVDHYDVADPLSCKAVFQKLPYKKRLQHLNIYVIVQWRELIHIGPSLSIPYINYRARLFHLLKLSHIFPVNSNIQGQNMSGSLYAEAVILPYILKFIGQGEFLEDAEGFIMSHSTLLGNSGASVAKSCSIPCSLRFGSTDLCGTLVSTYSSGSEGTVLNEPIVQRREYSSRILLEFKAGSFMKYQLPRINGSYILQCPSGSFTCTMRSCGCVRGGKVSIDSQDSLWSFAVTIDGNINIKGSIGDQSIGGTSVKMDELFSRNIIRDELRLIQPWNDFYHNSYFHLDFSCEAISKKMEEYNTVCHVLNGLCASSSEVLSVSSCVDIMMPKDASVSANFKTKEEAHGDLLISVQGKVENIHSLVCKWERCVPGNEKYSLCIHIADNNHAVYIRGYSNKHSTVGIGPGATVTFHRVRLKQHRLLLTSETYIEVSSISHANFTEQSVISSPKSNWLKDGSLSTASPCLFFHQKYFTDSRPMQFHCRVATVLVLVLNKLTNHGETPNVKVRLAGFILDDGSSLCCGWADDARAELLLRLQEISHLDASVNLKLSKGVNSTNLQYTIGCCLEKMLKKHTSVTVKNCGIPPDFSCRDLDASSVSDKVLSRLEDKLLKFIVLNACWKGSLNVITSALNPDDINGFNVELPVPVQNMRMLWIEEVFPVDPLEEARRLCDILEHS